MLLEHYSKFFEQQYYFAVCDKCGEIDRIVPPDEATTEGEAGFADWRCSSCWATEKIDPHSLLISPTRGDTMTFRLDTDCCETMIETKSGPTPLVVEDVRYLTITLTDEVPF